ncbi:formimidoyltransferase-cyclodeaminase-like isoform X2 [Gossypium australe]|uniref:glutamate formimidoyltransferase n=1 Tax=Gossypium australe TaxID=47621 RepID=A0A5B6WN96_9ROSI|nr:formimidoyltransferase-cyclodeaminase-like isoform X2 [Gossypium australe]
MDSAEDIFDSSLNLEETHYQEGYKEGYNHGVTTGKEEGKEVGLKIGFETGEELGFYKGCVDVWNSAIQINPTRFSTRVQKGIKQMQELIQKYPVMDPEDESVQEIMEALRLKFRVIRAALDLKQVERGGGEEKMLSKMLACGKVYISESRNRAALESIERAAKLFPEAAIVNKFIDDTYNRVGYTVVSRLTPKPSQDSCPLKDAVFAIVKVALETIDFGLHSGTHPRLGVVDHICFHPLAHASLDQTAVVAKSLAADIGSKLKVPTFLYGAAEERGRLLDSVRRELGYFKPNSGSILWSGGSKSESLPLKPDAGPTQVSPTKGVILIGTTHWVANYNVPVFSTDIAAVRRIAKHVSERGGGLPSVQAMGLAHGDGITEVACNLLKPNEVGGDRIQVEVERLAKEEGLRVGNGYFTDLIPDEIIERYMKLSSH